jgi:hypothetical protein
LIENIAMTAIPNLRPEDALLLMAMGMGLLIIFRVIKLRTVLLLIILSAAGYAFMPVLAEQSSRLPVWVSVLLLLWIVYASIRVLAGLILGSEVADHLLANILTLLLAGPLCAFIGLLRNLFRRQ